MLEILADEGYHVAAVQLGLTSAARILSAELKAVPEALDFIP